MFHMDCLDNWFTNKKRCPLCNVEMVLNEFIKCSQDEADLSPTVKVLLKEYQNMRDRCSLQVSKVGVENHEEFQIKQNFTTMS